MLELRQHFPLLGLLRLAGLPRSMKCELFYPDKFKCLGELKEALHEYIRYYNVDRIKLALKGLSPEAFRLQAAAAA